LERERGRGERCEKRNEIRKEMKERRKGGCDEEIRHVWCRRN
jgi:hypothetical protein